MSPQVLRGCSMRSQRSGGGQEEARTAGRGNWEGCVLVTLAGCLQQPWRAGLSRQGPVYCKRRAKRVGFACWRNAVISTYLSKMGQTQEVLWLGKAFVLLYYEMQMEPSSLRQDDAACKYQACLCPLCGWPILFFIQRFC